MTNRERERRLAAQQAKRERRELGRQAAAKRAAARRRRVLMKNGGPFAIAIVVLAGIVLYFTVFNNGGSTATAASDPLSSRPTVSAGTGTLTSLQVKTLIQGTGPVVGAGQTISVNYVGVNYTTGEQFDASWDHTPAGPTDFQIGTGQVIKGWDQALVGLKVGSRVQIDIPQSLAYPEATSGATAGPLRFVVDILSATGASITPSATPTGSPTPGVSPSASASVSPAA